MIEAPQRAEMRGRTQQLALQSALKYLAVAGAQFAVIDAEGGRHGELQVMPPPTGRTRVSLPPINPAYRHIEKCKSLKALGNSFEILCNEGEDVQRIVQAIETLLRQHIRNDQIELMGAPAPLKDAFSIMVEGTFIYVTRML
jgi:hypothetical protein